MKRSLLISMSLVGLGSLALLSQLVPDSTSTAKSQLQGSPRLVVMLVVDQMRADYFDRLGSRWHAGLGRLAKTGLRFTETYHDHAVTETAPGHATLVTGVHPARHGIVSNNWWDRVRQRTVYAVEDSTVSIVGVPTAEGRSPATSLRETVGDWLKKESPESKVFSVAIKDRVAVLMGGEHPDGAYWFSYSTGRYVTSTYYRSDYPAWVTAFNDSGPVRGYLGTWWDRLLPAETYTASRVDSFPAEHDGVHIVFPHSVGMTASDTTPSDSPTGEDLGGGFGEFATTPFGDAATFEFARRLIIEEGLGADETPDLLLVGASSADLIGHRYGPYSQEVEDYYLRLDLMLGEFLSFLDSTFGTDSYAFVLTSDHGVVMMPEEAISRGIDAVRVSVSDFQAPLIEGLSLGLFEYEILDQPSLQLVTPIGLAMRFNERPTDDQMLGLRAETAKHVRAAPVIADAFSYDELAADTTSDRRFLREIRHSFHRDRWSDVYLLFRENYLFPASLPTNHGSPYTYDTHVPLVFLIPGQSSAVVERRVRTVDVAPTIASLLGVTAPGDLDGVAISEAKRLHGTGPRR